MSVRRIVRAGARLVRQILVEFIARMRRSRFSIAATLASACLIVAGCTSLLGDFTSSSSQADAGLIVQADAASRDAGATTDGGRSSDAGSTFAADAAAPLACTSWRYASPVILETLSGGSRRVGADLAVFSTGHNQVRVIAGKPSMGIAFSVYSVDESQATPHVTQLDAPRGAGQLTTLRRSPSNIAPYTAVITYAPAGPDAGSSGIFSAYVLPDSMAAGGPLPAAFVVYQEPLLVPSVNALRVLPFGAADLFAAVVYPAQTSPVSYVLGVGRVTPTTPAVLSTVATTALAADLKSPKLFRANGEVTIYDQNDPSAPGLSAWAVPETGSVSTPPMERAVSAGAPADLDDIAENTTSAAADVAYHESTVSSAFTTSITYRAGTIAYDHLNAWVPADLPIVKTIADVFTAPTGIPCSSVWADDNLMLLGPGLRRASADGGVSPGLNLLWFDATGTVRSTESGTEALLTDRADFSNVAASPAHIDSITAAWNVVWVETKSDDAGAYDVLAYDELDCQ